jgi:hypothetical protein
MERLNRLTVDRSMADSRWHDGLTLRWLHASMAQKLTARRLNSLAVDGAKARQMAWKLKAGQLDSLTA